MATEFSNIKSLCLLRLSAIGDVCHAVAMVQAIQRQYPQLAITWVIGKVEYQLVQHIAGVNFVIFDKSRGWQSYVDLKRNLGKQQFDVLLHMQVALRATIASLMIKAKERIGFDKARAKEGQWLVTNRQIQPQHEPHVLDGFMGFATALGVKDITPRWTIPVPEADAEFVSSILSAGEKVFVICPAASKQERNWLPERYADVAQHACNQGFRVLLCGGPSDAEIQLAANIQQFCEAKIENWVGKTSLTQLLSVLKQATIVLAPDTGPAHMAVTQSTPVIGLYAHSNPGRTGPYCSQQYVVSVYHQAIAEQVQGEVPWGKRAKGAHLMSYIQTDVVIQQFDEVVSIVAGKNLSTSAN
ncbi:glycosyltransferase family 9 protein [Shewanella maritima]|uniref:glycosyltransferase family 9 protein n=1 Tax=Shewanella maritima TaxID=2520507 RepID=UPI003734FB98